LELQARLGEKVAEAKKLGAAAAAGKQQVVVVMAEKQQQAAAAEKQQQAAAVEELQAKLRAAKKNLQHAKKMAEEAKTEAELKGPVIHALSKTIVKMGGKKPGKLLPKESVKKTVSFCVSTTNSQQMFVLIHIHHLICPFFPSQKLLVCVNVFALDNSFRQCHSRIIMPSSLFVFSQEVLHQMTNMRLLKSSSINLTRRVSLACIYYINPAWKTKISMRNIATGQRLVRP
jgi:hypothetical protein